jgi:hypothetical protein
MIEVRQRTLPVRSGVSRLDGALDAANRKSQDHANRKIIALPRCRPITAHPAVKRAHLDPRTFDIRV